MSEPNSAQTTSSGSWWTGFASIVLQLLLLGTVIHLFRIEDGGGLDKIFPLIIGGFVMNAVLPRTIRPVVPVLLFLLVAMYLLGWLMGSVLIGIVALVYLISIAPVPLLIRTSVIILILGGCAVLNAGIFSLGKVDLLMPIVGSIFMFRIILYLYELKNGTVKDPGIHGFSYFAMFPNLLFLLFPIVDFKTYVRSYYARKDLQIYRTGVKFIFWGVLHILAHRYVYHNWVPLKVHIDDVQSLSQFLITAYLVVLHLSGIFHIAVGTMCLFGYDLPRVFTNYFLISTFRDIWRRINSYWRDFIMKVFYTPIFLKAKRFGQLKAIFICTLFMFFITWILHNYQFFWLTGKVHFRASDILYWMILGTFITADIYLSVTGKKSKLKITGFSSALKWATYVVGIFLFMSFMWSFWTMDRLTEWAFVLQNSVSNSSVSDILLVVGIIAGLIVLTALIRLIWTDRKWGVTIPAVVRVVSLSAFIGIFYASTEGMMPSNIAASVSSLYDPGKNDPDRFELEQGYYEEILFNGFGTSEPFKFSERPHDMNELRNGLTHLVDNLLIRDLVPDTSGVFRNTEFSTNSFGMRDKEYALEVPEGTDRIALVGGSYEMGSGVSQGMNFESLLEDEWNSKEESPLEILNFSGGGFQLIQSVYLIETRAIDFSPDHIILAVHTEDDYRMVASIARIIYKDQDLRYEYLKELVEELGLTGAMSKTELMYKLYPKVDLIRAWAYGYIAALCEENGIGLSLLYLPATEDELDPDERERIFTLARSNGMNIIDLSSVYDGVEMDDIMVSQWDSHPNEDGHRIIADLIYPELIKLIDNE